MPNEFDVGMKKVIGCVMCYNGYKLNHNLLFERWMIDNIIFSCIPCLPHNSFSVFCLDE